MVQKATADDVVRARVNSEVKREATAILASIGLTPSDAFRMMLMRVVQEGALPFEPLVPNDTTIAAIREGRVAELPHFASVQDLMNDLNADD